MAQFPFEIASHSGAQRLVFPSKVHLLCQNTYTYNICLREREQVETNLGGIPTVVGRNAVDLKMLNAEARRTTDRSIKLVSTQIISLRRRTQQPSKFEQLIGSKFNADLNRINPPARPGSWLNFRLK